MRAAVVTSLALALSAPSAMAESPTMADIRSLPCKTYLATVGTRLYYFVLMPIAETYSDMGTACAIGRYVEAECKAAPTKKVVDALDVLMAKQKRGKMPEIGRCGA